MQAAETFYSILQYINDQLSLWKYTRQCKQNKLNNPDATMIRYSNLARMYAKWTLTISIIVKTKNFNTTMHVALDILLNATTHQWHYIYGIHKTMQQIESCQFQVLIYASTFSKYLYMIND